MKNYNKIIWGRNSLYAEKRELIVTDEVSLEVWSQCKTPLEFAFYYL